MSYTEIPGGVTAAQGFLAGSAYCGIKASNVDRPDIALIHSPQETVAAATFTTNKVKAAPVRVSMAHLRSGDVRAIVLGLSTLIFIILFLDQFVWRPILATAERYHHAKERAFIDDVTGVYNARYLLATADNEIQRAARYGNPLSVLFLDLDRFKSVNDVHGHLVGSDTLRALARLLSECVRQVDTLARYGGDEFTILLVDTPHDVAVKVAERIRSRIEAQLFEAGREGTLRLTISIGVATCPSHGSAREPLLDAADKAMYRAKSDGRNRVCSADDLGPAARPPQ